MAERIPQSLAKLVVFRAFLVSTGLPATGKTIAVMISKNGATSFSNPAAGATNATEMASGWYKVALGVDDTDTLGPLALRGAEGTILDVGDVYEVEPYYLDAAISTVATQSSLNDGLTYLTDTLASQASVDTMSAAVDAIGPVPTVEEIRTEMDSNSTKLVHLDADISTVTTQDSFNDSMSYLAATLDALPVDVKAQLVEALTVDTYAEPASVPPPTATLERKLGQLYKHLVNEHNVTNASDTLRNDDDSEDIVAQLSDDGTTGTRTKWSDV